MKKKIIALFLLLMVVGCQNINNLDYATIVKNIVTSKQNITNQYRSGYKYYLPKGLRVENQYEYNEKISSRDNTYYIFVDFVSYYNNKQVTYEINETAFYSQIINNGKKFGYIEIKAYNDKFYIEMMYNYAKIEVVSDKGSLNDTITKSIILLSSIQYNDKIIANIIGEDILSFKEEQYNIFEPKKNPKKFIDYIENENVSDGGENNIPDYDFIK